MDSPAEPLTTRPWLRGRCAPLDPPARSQDPASIRDRDQTQASQGQATPGATGPFRTTCGCGPIQVRRLRARGPTESPARSVIKRLMAVIVTWQCLQRTAAPPGAAAAGRSDGAGTVHRRLGLALSRLCPALVSYAGLVKPIAGTAVHA